MIYSECLFKKILFLLHGINFCFFTYIYSNKIDIAITERNYPIFEKAAKNALRAPQKISTNFLAANQNDIGFHPPIGANFCVPDTMGCVGPTQFIVAVNGLVRSFNKENPGQGDGAINTTLNNFFISRGIGNILDTFFDPQIRFDKLSQRWFLVCCYGFGTQPEDTGKSTVAIAVSTENIITSSTVWNVFSIGHPNDKNPPGSQFTDRTTLGVGTNAIYIGTNQYLSKDEANYIDSLAIVIDKNSLLKGIQLVEGINYSLTHLDGISQPAVGTPEGADIFDPSATKGYFIGSDFNFLSTLHLIRVNDPTNFKNPKFENLTVTTETSPSIPIYSNPLPVQQPNSPMVFPIDGGDIRCLCSHVRNNSLYTIQNVGINDTGNSQANPEDNDRTGCRWYQFAIPPETSPLSETTLTQVGTLYDATNSKASYIYGSIMSTGQTNMAIGATHAGPLNFANAATAGRLSSDPLNTLQPDAIFTDAKSDYNGCPDEAHPNLQRWGDYSYTSCDPNDNMTLWTIQEFTFNIDNWGVQVAKLLAPPPVTPSSTNPQCVQAGQVSVDLEITGKSINGSGFYDPGIGFPNHLQVNITDVIVNSVKYIDPTHILVNISTEMSSIGHKDITVTNPDGQTTTGIGIMTIAEMSASLAANPTTICLGTSSTLTATVTGVPPYTINWIDGAQQISDTSPILRIVMPTATTTYFFMAVDVNGCSAESNAVTVTVSQPFVTLTASKIVINPGELVILTAVPEGDGPFTLVWSDGIVNQNVTGPVMREVHPTKTTTYNLTIIDANGCKFDPPRGVTITVLQKRSVISEAIIAKYCS